MEISDFGDYLIHIEYKNSIACTGDKVERKYYSHPSVSFFRNNLEFHKKGSNYSLEKIEF
jgi:hypothetical protein